MTGAFDHLSPAHECEEDQRARADDPAHEAGLRAVAGQSSRGIWLATDAPLSCGSFSVSVVSGRFAFGVCCAWGGWARVAVFCCSYVRAVVVYNAVVMSAEEHAVVQPKITDLAVTKPRNQRSSVL